MVNEIKYRPEIDGLRAIAVATVVLFHANLGFRGGFIGVDVFFVISGFLITKIILRDIDRKVFSMPRFWLRRIRRLFPAMAVMLAVVLAVGFKVMPPYDLRELGISSIAQLFFLSNYYFASEANYFATSAEKFPLLHTWSLSLEEQFYLLFPIGLLMISKFPTKLVRYFILLTGILSFAVNIRDVGSYPAWTFFSLPSRAWELMAGAFLATLSDSKLNRRSNEFIALMGLLGILIPAIAFNSNTVFPGFAALLPVTGTSFFIFANSGNQTTNTGQVIASKYFVGLGLISYSVYLWHWPIIAFLNYFEIAFTTSISLLIILASVAMGYVSWRFVEQPFRKTEKLQSNRLLLFAVATSMLIFISTSVYFWKTQGVPSRLPQEIAKLVSYTGNSYVTRFDLENGKIPEQIVRLGIKTENKELDFVIIGDSHALMYCSTIDKIARHLGLAGGVLGQYGHPPYPYLEQWKGDTRQIQNVNKLFDFLEESDVKTVFLIARFHTYTDKILEAEGQRQHAHLITAYLNRIHEMLGEKLILLKGTPNTMSPIGKNLQRNYLLGFDYFPIETSSYTAHREKHLRFGKSLANSTIPADQVIDPTNLFFPDGNQDGIFEKDGAVLYEDTNHLTREGAELVVDLLKPHLEKLSKKQ